MRARVKVGYVGGRGTCRTCSGPLFHFSCPTCERPRRLSPEELARLAEREANVQSVLKAAKEAA
jgi:hypothetical protein